MRSFACSGHFIVFSIILWIADATGFYELGPDGRRHFNGYTVIRMVPIDDNAMDVIQALAKDEENAHLDFWKPPTKMKEPVDVMVPPEKALAVHELLLENQIPNVVLIPDVERYVMKELADINSPPEDLSGRDSDYFFTRYQSLREIHQFLDDLNSTYPEITEIYSVGNSSEKKDLKAIKIGKKSNKEKPIIWIDGGIHAREWISPATVTYIASRLVRDYQTDEEVKELVDAFDWYILPVVNPDGYEYSRRINRMWRKSRRAVPQALWYCKGVDLNRNWSYHWREGGSSRNPCQETYAGTEAFSEPETKSISDFILQRKENLVSFVSVHSYSQLWLTPWGWTSELPKDYSSMVTVAQEAVDALSKLYGTKYKIGSSTNVLYLAAGGADDWAHGEAGAKYAYTLELRDTGRYGFLLPAEQILPTGEETFAGIKTMAKAIHRAL